MAEVKLGMLHSNTSKVTILKQNWLKLSLLFKKNRKQKKKTPNQKANAAVQSSDELTEAKNVTTAIIQVKYM